MTEQHKLAIKLGREKAKIEKLSLGIPLLSSITKKTKPTKGLVNGKYTLVIDNQELDAFDFIPKIRAVLRSNHNYILSPKIEKEIVDKRFWQNVEWIKNCLSKYFNVETKETSVKKVRKVRKPMSEENRLKMAENLKRAREIRKNKEQQNGN